MHPLTVLQVLPALYGGGVERGTVEVVGALTDKRVIAIVASAGGPMANEVEDAGGRHITLPLDSKNPLVMLANIGRLVRLIRDHNVDIVHARSRAPAWSAYFAARLANRAFVTTFHNAYGIGNPFKRLYNSVMAKGVRVIAISHFVADYATRVYGVPREKLRIIPRGVDVEEFDPAAITPERIDALRREWQLQEGAPVIVLPGRLTRWKGQLVLVAALARLGRRDIVCLMVGSGAMGYRQEIEESANRQGLGAVVRITAHCRDMPAAMMLADIVVSASTRPEGFGRVIVEAQALGRAVIATGHGGACETVIPGETGLLVPPNDAAALADAIARLLAFKAEERADLGQRACAHVRAHFTTKIMTDAVLAVYDEVMEGRSA